jgi:hypothetical protein
VSVITKEQAEELDELTKIVKQQPRKPTASASIEQPTRPSAKLSKRAQQHADLMASVGDQWTPPVGDLTYRHGDDGEPPSRDDPNSVTLARLLAAVEGNRVIPLGEAARLLAISKSTIKRNYGDLLVRVGARRVGLKLKDVLSLVKAA